MLPSLLYENLLPTRNYLQNITLAIGAVSRAYLPEHPREWQYGLEVSMRGIQSQQFTANNEALRISLDLVTYKVRIHETSWSLHEYAAPEIFKNLKLWLANHGMNKEIEQPDWVDGGTVFNTEQSTAYSKALWWLEREFAALKAERTKGVTSPLLLYPHHFDLSLVWFPQDDDAQIGLGFSTGDRTIPEPYIYCTAYPEPKTFIELSLPGGAYWQPTGFSGAILPYATLQASNDPSALLHTYASSLFECGQPLLG